MPEDKVGGFWSDQSMEVESVDETAIIKQLSKGSDFSRGWPGGSLFDSYYTKV